MANLLIDVLVFEISEPVEAVFKLMFFITKHIVNNMRAGTNRLRNSALQGLYQVSSWGGYGIVTNASLSVWEPES